MSEQPTQDSRKLADTVREAFGLNDPRGTATAALDALVSLAEQYRTERDEALDEGLGDATDKFNRELDEYVLASTHAAIVGRERAARESAEREDKRHLEMAAELEGRLESAEAALRAAQARADELEKALDAAETQTVAWAEQVDAVLAAADSLADTYGRVWAKDAKFYAYEDARHFEAQPHVSTPTKAVQSGAEEAALVVQRAFSRWHAKEHDDVNLIEQEILAVLAASPQAGEPFVPITLREGDRVNATYGEQAGEEMVSVPGPPGEPPVLITRSEYDRLTMTAQAGEPKRPCTCGEGEACDDPGCRGPYYDEIKRLAEAVPTDAELRRHIVRGEEAT